MSFFFSSRRRHTRWPRDWSSDVCSSDLTPKIRATQGLLNIAQAVMPGMPPAKFDFYRPRCEIKLIVHHQYFLGFYFVKTGNGRQGLTRTIHKCGRFGK